MEIVIHKGTNQIGGCISEIRTERTKIIIDFGEDLSDEEFVKKKFVIPGLNDNSKSEYNAVFITHSHLDHVGKINEINDDIDIYIENDTKKIYNLTCEFTGKESVNKKTKNVEFGQTIVINNDIKVTPYIVDHSAYNSCMYLIEADGKRILHTGDYRNHGKKGKIFEKNLNLIGKVDALITEGTTFGRFDEKYKTEEEIYLEAVKIFNKYDDILILQSSTNIDRLVSFYRASLSTKKYFIEDLFTATLVSNLSKNIPSPIGNYLHLSVWIPYKYRNKDLLFKEKYIKPMEKYKSDFAFHNNICMLVKSSMLEDIKFLKNEKHKLKNACLIYSMWDGYLEDENMLQFKNELKKLNIDFISLHTSGHADIMTMKRLNEILKPDKVIPIHTNNKEYAKEIFDNIIDLNDGEVIKI